MRFSKIGLVIAGVVLVAVVACVAGSQMWFGGETAKAGGEQLPKLDLIGTETLAVPKEVIESLGIRTAQVQQASRPRTLELPGNTVLDANFLAKVRARFPGEVVEISTLPDPDASGRDGKKTGNRPLDVWDRVNADQLLAVVWSFTLGEKKSELVDAVSRLRLDQDTLRKLEQGYLKGIIPERSVREAERNVEADRIAAERAQQTLRSWRLPEQEIQSLELLDVITRLRQDTSRLQKLRELASRENINKQTVQEAEEIAKADQEAVERAKLTLRSSGFTDEQVKAVEEKATNSRKDWARVEVRAPFAGTVVERNVAMGDMTDGTQELFKIADLTHLRVFANVYEEDLRALESVPKPIPWTVRLASDRVGQGVAGFVDKIGVVIDPNDHTGRLMGRVDNRKGLILSGQFVTTTIDLPAPADEVQVPSTAVVGTGRDTMVFVQPDPSKAEFVPRRVNVVRRLKDVVFLRGSPPAKEGEAAVEPLRPGTSIATSGAIELKSALEDLQSTKK